MIFWLYRNHWKIVLTLFWAVVTFTSARWGLHEKYDSPQEADKKFSLGKGAMEKRGSRECSPWAASPLGERVGHPHSLLKMESYRISTEPIFLIR
jgi:hypothetical protein